jgi:hypothetical protein
MITFSKNLGDQLSIQILWTHDQSCSISSIRVRMNRQRVFAMVWISTSYNSGTNTAHILCSHIDFPPYLPMVYSINFKIQSVPGNGAISVTYMESNYPAMLSYTRKKTSMFLYLQ